jgi:hypothetical protein
LLRKAAGKSSLSSVLPQLSTYFSRHARTPKKATRTFRVSQARGEAAEPDAWSLDDHWPDLLAGLADQITEGVSTLQSSIDQLLAKGRITKARAPRAQHTGRTHQAWRYQRPADQPLLRWPHSPVARKSGHGGTGRRRAAGAKQELGVLGIALRRKLKPVEVLIDPTVAHTFVNAVLDWGLPFGSRVDVRMDLNAWPQHARLQVRVSNDGVPPSSHPSRQPELDADPPDRPGGGGIEIDRDHDRRGREFHGAVQPHRAGRGRHLRGRPVG